MDFEEIKKLPADDLVHALIVQMPKEELYEKALIMKDKDLEKYHMYIVMASNYGYQLAKDEFYDYYYKKVSLVAALQQYPIDAEKAKRFYEHTKDYSYSSFLLGEMYHHKLGVDQDYAKAKELYELAIKQDDTNTFAYWNLALMYDHGLGVDKDDKMSRKYYKMSELKKSPYSVYRAACFTLEKNNGKDWRQAEKMFKECIIMSDEYKDQSVKKLVEIYENTRYLKNRLKKEIVDYFAEIEKTDELKKLYGYDDNAIYVIKQNAALKKQAAAVDLGLYFKSLITVTSK